MVKILITVLVSWNRSRKKNYRLISYRIFRNLLNHSKRILLLLYKEQSAVVSLGSTPIWTNPNWTTPNWTYPIWTWSTPKVMGGSQRVLLKKMAHHQSSTTCGAIDDRRISLKAIDERVFTKFRDKKCRIYPFSWQKCRIYPFSRQKCRIYPFLRQKCRIHTFLGQKSLVP